MLRYVMLLSIPLFAFASGDGAEPEVMKRTINFLLFAGLLYYVLFNKFKIQEFFKNRRNTIAQRLSVAQEKLKEAQNKKTEAMEQLEKTKANAKSFIATSQKESKLLLAKMATDLTGEFDNLKKTHKDQIDIERRKMVRQVVSEVINELFGENNIHIDRDKFVDIIMKKVA